MLICFHFVIIAWLFLSSFSFYCMGCVCLLASQMNSCVWEAEGPNPGPAWPWGWAGALPGHSAPCLPLSSWLFFSSPSSNTHHFYLRAGNSIVAYLGEFQELAHWILSTVVWTPGSHTSPSFPCCAAQGRGSWPLPGAGMPTRSQGDCQWVKSEKKEDAQ